MKVIINNEQTKNKELYYEEGFWTGKRTIKYNNILLTKIKGLGKKTAERIVLELKEKVTAEEGDVETTSSSKKPVMSGGIIQT